MCSLALTPTTREKRLLLKSENLILRKKISDFYDVLFEFNKQLNLIEFISNTDKICLFWNCNSGLSKLVPERVPYRTLYILLDWNSQNLLERNLKCIYIFIEETSFYQNTVLLSITGVLLLRSFASKVRLRYGTHKVRKQVRWSYFNKYYKKMKLVNRFLFFK